MLKNAYFLAKIGANTAENEQHFAEILPIGRRVAEHGWLRPAEPLEPRAAGARVVFCRCKAKRAAISCTASGSRVRSEMKNELNNE